MDLIRTAVGENIISGRVELTLLHILGCLALAAKGERKVTVMIYYLCLNK